MNLSPKQKQSVKDAFESILRADYISLDQLDQLADLEKYYIDFYNNIGSLLQKQDNYISGRRGTGKTALLIRGYYECLKTISPKISQESEIFGDKKILPVYVDLSNCNEIFNSDENISLIEVHFVRQIIESLKRQLGVMFDDHFLLVFKKENPALDDLEYIEKVLVEGIALLKERKVGVTNKAKSTEMASLSAHMAPSETGIGSEVCSTEEMEKTTQSIEIRGLNVQDLLSKINDIRRKAKIDSIFVFLDEFSDLNSEAQEKFSSLLKNFLGSKINMFFKIGVITDRYNFGNKIIIGRDIFPIPLDLNEYVERYGGVVTAIKKMQEFIEKLIEKRLDIFCPKLDYDDIFKLKKEVLYHRLAREALGVPRTIGLILQNAWIQCQSNGSSTESKIGLQEINFGMRSARKMYSKQFQGSIKKRLIPGFYMDLWNSILEKALSEKAKHSDRPASHILIDPIRKDYMNLFCENFLIHYLEESRTSKYGGNYNLYSIDYDICLDNNIKYAEEKDEFTAVRFVYDSVLSKYDAYFTKDKIKSYKCNQCGKIYEEKDVSKFKVKRCFEDDTKLEEIIHKEMPRTEGNYAEVEIKILGLISSLIKGEEMSAQEIADAVGCSRQKVSLWGSKFLAKKKLINIIHKDGRNYYYSTD